MKTATNTIELARMNQDGSWELIGDFATMKAVLEAAEANCDGAYHLDDDSVVFGASEDPASGHYETRIGVWPGTGAMVLS
jgi:hypothetical protein